MTIKVLLVEDDPSLREALGETLALAGHDYQAVGSGRPMARGPLRSSPPACSC